MYQEGSGASVLTLLPLVECLKYSRIFSVFRPYVWSTTTTAICVKLLETRKPKPVPGELVTQAYSSYMINLNSQPSTNQAQVIDWITNSKRCCSICAWTTHWPTVTELNKFRSDVKVSYAPCSSGDKHLVNAAQLRLTHGIWQEYFKVWTRHRPFAYTGPIIKVGKECCWVQNVTAPDSDVWKRNNDGEILSSGHLIHLIRCIIIASNWQEYLNLKSRSKKNYFNIVISPVFCLNMGTFLLTWKAHNYVYVFMLIYFTQEDRLSFLFIWLPYLFHLSLVNERVCIIIPN